MIYQTTAKRMEDELAYRGAWGAKASRAHLGGVEHRLPLPEPLDSVPLPARRTGGGYSPLSCPAVAGRRRVIPTAVFSMHNRRHYQ